MAVGGLLTLGLYLVQQVGVMLGIGATLVLMVAHLVSQRDGVIGTKEAHFAGIIERLRLVGLASIVVSGVAITVLHGVAGQTAIIFSPAYLFKWILIGVVALPLLKTRTEVFPPVLREGFFGATWGALFILHVIAPITSWVILLGLYVLWTATFLLFWEGVAYLLRPRPPKPKPSVTKKPAPTPIYAPLAPRAAPVIPKLLPKPTLPLKPLITSVLAALPKPPIKPKAVVAPPKPAPAIPVKPPQKPQEKTEDGEYAGLPKIRVMPRTVEDIQKQDRASVVQFNSDVSVGVPIRASGLN